MAYSAASIANWLLGNAKKECAQLSPMKVQKLVYFCHAWNLAIFGEPLIKESVQAWRHGPVIQSLYREFKDFGNRPIDRMAIDIRVVPGKDGLDSIEEYEPSMREEHADLGDNWPTVLDPGIAQALINRVWEIYGKYTAIQLSNLTHAEGSPWSLVLKKYGGAIPRGLHIPNELIRDCFRKQLPSQPEPRETAGAT